MKSKQEIDGNFSKGNAMKRLRTATHKCFSVMTADCMSCSCSSISLRKQPGAWNPFSTVWMQVKLGHLVADSDHYHYHQKTKHTTEPFFFFFCWTSSSTIRALSLTLYQLLEENNIFARTCASFSVDIVNLHICTHLKGKKCLIHSWYFNKMNKIIVFQ